MYKINVKTLFLAVTLITIIPATLCANDHKEKASDRAFYLTAKGGIGLPANKSFAHQDKEVQGAAGKTLISFKKSKLFGGDIGYSFYPNMSIEFSYVHHPEFYLGYKLPVTPEINTLLSMAPGSFQDKNGKTRVHVNTYIVSLVYKTPEFMTISPYVLFGAGVSQVNVKSTSSKIHNHALFGNIEYFQLLKTRTNCPTVSVGIGADKKINDNFSINFSTKLYVVKSPRMRYSVLTDPITKAYKEKPAIKKTLGFFDIALGIKYNLPF